MRRMLRRARRSAVQIHGSIASRLPGALEKHRETWRSRDVAAQMAALTERELAAVPESVPPFAAFLRLLPVLVEDDAMPCPARLLDIGCGVGAYGELVERYAPGRFAYVGADYSREIIEIARQRSPARDFVERDLFAPGALDGFDVIFASALLDVLAEPERALDVLLGADARWMVLHRQRVRAGRCRVGVVRGYRGQTTYSTTVSQRVLGGAVARSGRRVAASTHVDGDVWSFLLLRDGC
jgi:SAM-dependent methyltransferase